MLVARTEGLRSLEAVEFCNTDSPPDMDDPAEIFESCMFGRMLDSDGRLAACGDGGEKPKGGEVEATLAIGGFAPLFEMNRG